MKETWGLKKKCKLYCLTIKISPGKVEHIQGPDNQKLTLKTEQGGGLARDPIKQSKSQRQRDTEMERQRKKSTNWAAKCEWEREESRITGFWILRLPTASLISRILMRQTFNYRFVKISPPPLVFNGFCTVILIPPFPTRKGI